VVDHTAPHKTFDHELVTVVHLMGDLDKATLEHVHFIRKSVDSVEKRTFLQLTLFHRKNPLIFDLSWQIGEKIDLVEAHLEKDLQRVIVCVNVRLDRLVEQRVYLEELVVIGSVNLSAGAVVP